MSFKKNSSQQLSLSDSFSSLTAREQKALEKSWAKVFADEIFPFIDENRFSVLYSSNEASRPNTPVNVTVGSLIIKEIFEYSDDEMVEGLMLDSRLQYALHTTSFEEQPLSDKTLSRFRARCYEYETLYNVDLYRDCVKDLSKAIAKMMKLNGNIKRMDSMMIEANIRHLSRMELIYNCISKMVIYLNKNHPELLNDDLKVYADSNNYNRVFYYKKSTGMEDVKAKLLSDSETLLEILKDDFINTIEYKLLVRCLSEQTIIENGERRLRTKEDGCMTSTLLQNPSDPEATFRNKSGKDHRGYIANIEETVGEAGSVVTDYRYEQNTYSDSQFLKDNLSEAGKQEEKTVLVTDGGYSGSDNTLLAEENNIQLISTSLLGKEAPDVFADFEFNEDGTKLLKCAAGYCPRSCNYNKANGQINISFDRNQCAGCPYQEQCNPKIYKKVARFTTSKNASERAKYQRYMDEDEFKNYAKLRNGVETVPSNIRRNYHLDKLPRGKQRGKFFFGCKIAALNFKKLLNYRRGTGNYAQNPVIA